MTVDTSSTFFDTSTQTGEPNDSSTQLYHEIPVNIRINAVGRCAQARGLSTRGVHHEVARSDNGRAGCGRAEIGKLAVVAVSVPADDDCCRDRSSVIIVVARGVCQK